MSAYDWTSDIITQIDEVIEKWEPCRKDFAWDGGKLNHFITELEDFLSQFRNKGDKK